MRLTKLAGILAALGFCLVLLYKIQLDAHFANLSVKEPVRILVWDHYYTTEIIGKNKNDAKMDCGVCSCEILHDYADLGVSDAVWFDRRNRNMKQGDYFPDNHPSNQYWIIYNQEPVVQEQNRAPIPEGVFNISTHYSTKSDIPLTYGHCERRVDSSYSIPKDFIRNKTGLVLWHVSHCRTYSYREHYVRKLKKIIPVDIFGKCGQKKFPDRMRPGMEHMPDTIVDQFNNYKFYLAFENSMCEDYITEKPFKILQDDVYAVPIVKGNVSYSDILPEGSYIDAGKYTPEELAQYLTKLDQNDELYKRFFSFRQKFKCYNHAVDAKYLPCRICDAVFKIKQSGKRRMLGKDDIDKLFSVKNCHPGPYA